MVKLRFAHTLLFLGMLLTAMGHLSAQSLKIEASVDRNPVGLQETFTYEVTISGESQNLPEVELPPLENFAIIRGPSVSSSFQIINFNMKASKTYSLVLMPREVGKFTIPPATAEWKGKTVQSNAVEITVVKGTTQSAPAPQSGRQRGGASGAVDLSKALFLKAIPSKQSVFVNEQVNVSYKIYFRVNIRNPEFVKLPQAVGFWVEDYPLNKNLPVHTETLNGVQYNVVEIKKMALFPTKAGELSVSPMVVAVDAVVRQQRRDPFDLFDDFFDNPFGQMVRKELVSNPVTIKVEPLPEVGKPADFSGLVGDFRLTSSLDKTTVPANEALSLKVKISGTGHLKILNQLPLEFPPNFEVYEPKISENIGRTGNYLSVNKEFEYVIIPRVPGEFKIPPLRLSYFNPFEKQYRELTTPEYRIVVTRGKELAEELQRTFLAKENIKLLGKDVRFIKDELDLLPMGYRPYRTVWFWAAIVLPLLGMAGAFGYRQHLDRMAGDVGYARKRRATRQARQRLKAASRELKAGNFAAFYGEVARALVGFIADKTNRPAAGLMREEIVSLLQQYQVDEELQQQFLKHLDEADFRRFAPSQNQIEDAPAFYEQAVNLLTRLEKYF